MILRPLGTTHSTCPLIYLESFPVVQENRLVSGVVSSWDLMQIPCRAKATQTKTFSDGRRLTPLPERSGTLCRMVLCMFRELFLTTTYKRRAIWTNEDSRAITEEYTFRFFLMVQCWCAVVNIRIRATFALFQESECTPTMARARVDAVSGRKAPSNQNVGRPWFGLLI